MGFFENYKKKKAAEAAKLAAQENTEVENEAVEEPKKANPVEMQAKINEIIEKINAEEPATEDDTVEAAPVAETVETADTAETVDTVEAVDVAEDANTAESVKPAEMEEAVKAEEPEAPAEIKAEEVKAEETKTEAPQEKPVKKRIRRKKSEIQAAEASGAEEATENTEAAKTVARPASTVKELAGITLFGDKYDYEEAIDFIYQYYDEEKRFTEEDEYNAIFENTNLVDPGINAGGLKGIISQLDVLRQQVMRMYIKDRSNYEILAAKDKGMTDYYYYMNNNGSNAEERKRNGLASLRDVEIGGRKFNLIALLANARRRLTFSETLLTSIDKRANYCITMLGAINNESRAAAITGCQNMGI